jgi:hypothetical protein
MPHNAAVTNAIEVAIDVLYALPLAEFVTARQALAKTLKGQDARRVKALAKPTTLPWVVNLLKWRDPGAFDRVMALGAAVRAAQIAALEGRGTTLREATATLRPALAEAALAGVQMAAAHGVTVDPDAVSRMLETVSLAEQLAEAPGRFTSLVQPAGFEALMGVEIVATSSARTSGRSDAAGSDARTPPPAAKPPLRFPAGAARVASVDPAIAAAAERRERQRRAAREQRAQTIAAAEALLAAAKQREAEARDAWHRAKDVVDAALQAVEAARLAT